MKPFHWFVLVVMIIAVTVLVMRGDDATKPAPTFKVNRATASVACEPSSQEVCDVIAAKDATIQHQQQLINALQAKMTALLGYMSADEQIRALQAQPAANGK